MDGLSSIAQVSRALQDKQIERLTQRMEPEKHDVSNLFLFSHYDASPILVHFGSYVDVITPHARYLNFNKELQKWEALPIEKFRNVTQRAVPRKGVVQVLAQRMKVFCRAMAGHQRPLS
jgi:hypothetical protein